MYILNENVSFACTSNAISLEVTIGDRVLSFASLLNWGKLC